MGPWASLAKQIHGASTGRRNLIPMPLNEVAVSLKPEGEIGIGLLGHRAYVGGLWDEIGALQFNFLVSQGLRPSDCLLDIACGCLRGGVHFIRFLDAGNYLGIDKEARLIELGVDQELGRETLNLKRPEFVVSSDFEFSFSKRPNYSIAQSLFTHLNRDDIMSCMSSLRKIATDDHVFFATYLVGNSRNCPAVSHSHARFEYSVEEMCAFGQEAGWAATHIGDWGHPRHQQMMRYQVRA